MCIKPIIPLRRMIVSYICTYVYIYILCTIHPININLLLLWHVIHTYGNLELSGKKTSAEKEARKWNLPRQNNAKPSDGTSDETDQSTTQRVIRQTDTRYDREVTLPQILSLFYGKAMLAEDSFLCCLAINMKMQIIPKFIKIFFFQSK